MRLGSWILIGALAVGIGLGLIARAADADGLYVVSGIALLVAIVILVARLPFLRGLGIRPPAMSGLFVRPGPGETWSTQEGRPVPPVPKAGGRRKPLPGARIIERVRRR